MFKTINLGMLSLAAHHSQEQAFLAYEKSLTGREDSVPYRAEELESIVSLLHDLSCVAPLGFGDLDGFAYSYRVPQIREEMDLVRVGESLVLNIELKSQMVPEDRIRSQLLRKRHYLSRLGKEVLSFTYVADFHTLYKLQDGQLAGGDFLELYEVIRASSGYVVEDLDTLFDPAKFLISPILNVEEFLAGEYFLTQQQDDYKRAISGLVTSPDTQLVVLEGGPGVGKTLVLFDVAKSVWQGLGKRVLVVHCGPIQPEHRQFNESQEGIAIVSPNEVTRELLDNVGMLCLDETQRLAMPQVERVFALASRSQIPCLVSYDPGLFPTRDAEGLFRMTVAPLFAGVSTFSLSSRMRSSQEISRFTRALGNVRAERPRLYEHVNVCYAQTLQQGKDMVSYWQEKGFEYLNMGEGLQGRGVAEVAGLEFDDVVLVLDGRFAYSEQGKLRTLADGNESKRKLDAALSRIRRGLALVVLGAPELFDTIQMKVIGPGLDM